jgi:hypothetical protein
LQVLSGRGVVVRRRRPDGNAHTLRLDCPNDRTGWMVSYNGGEPHIGSLSGAAPGTKVSAMPRWLGAQSGLATPAGQPCADPRGSARDGPGS